VAYFANETSRTSSESIVPFPNADRYTTKISPNFLPAISTNPKYSRNPNPNPNHNANPTQKLTLMQP